MPLGVIMSKSAVRFSWIGMGMPAYAGMTWVKRRLMPDRKAIIPQPQARTCERAVQAEAERLPFGTLHS